mmetsp:Transcript_28221/g.42713  ORF Transcript_28221/g.42713 Transcript_28221/m.42713 type:complete len:104 (+) Transcript_28221:175-486(+)
MKASWWDIIQTLGLLPFRILLTIRLLLKIWLPIEWAVMEAYALYKAKFLSDTPKEVTPGEKEKFVTPRLSEELLLEKKMVKDPISADTSLSTIEDDDEQEINR